MVQALKDYAQNIRRDRKTQVVTALAVIALIYLVFGDGGRVRRPRETKPVQVGANDPNERWQDLIERFNGQLNQLSAQTNANRQDLDSLKKSMQDYEATTAEIFKKILERLAEVQNAAGGGSGGLNPRTLDDVAGAGIDATGPDELESLTPAEPVADQPPPAPAAPRMAAIMPGDSVRIKLLAGVNAPTDGTPYPVVVKLISDVIGPDGNALPLGEARMIVAAQGSLTDSRALFRLTRLSLRLPNGRRKEFAVDGWIVGEDGIRGMEGVLIDPIGKAIAGAGFAGALAGVGEGIAAGNTVNQSYSNGNRDSYVQNGKIPEYAGGVALSSMAREWDSIIRERLSQLVPVVQVLSGREGTAIFSQSLAIPDLLGQLEDEDSSVVFTSLD